MDERKLLPGQNWPRAIESAIETSDFFLACYSANSVNKKGGFQAEIRYALDCARQIPLEEIFIVPVRLNPLPGAAIDPARVAIRGPVSRLDRRADAPGGDVAARSGAPRRAARVNAVFDNDAPFLMRGRAALRA